MLIHIAIVASICYHAFGPLKTIYFDYETDFNWFEVCQLCTMKEGNKAMSSLMVDGITFHF